ncbi:uncharacterized protein [Pseudorasbora parva]|uniref:uncharacterized protein n=1 Tax=Pseudorasbora parva TaxID=51549 RepID=UPI00351EB4A2
MKKGVFIIIITDSSIFYKDYILDPSLDCLPYQFKNLKNYDIKLKVLKDIYNEDFNEWFHHLDTDTKDCIKAMEEQIAILVLIRKDGSFDEIKVIKKHDCSEGEHTEDQIFKRLQEIYNESQCDYSEIYIFSTNSPCLARKDYVPCMISAIFWAYHLNKKHGIKIIMGYGQSYGLIGTYSNNVIKDWISTFDLQTFERKNINKAACPSQNQTQQIKSKYMCDFKNNFPEIANGEIYKKLNEIQHILFQDLKLDQESTYSFKDFTADGSERFDKCSKEIHKVLRLHDKNISDKVIKRLKTGFDRWWPTQLEKSTKFLRQKLNNYLLYLALMEIDEIQNMLGRNFFEIGIVTFNLKKC